MRRLLGVRDSVAGDAVGLTFDDGPHPEATPQVLELLAARGATATFFLVGEQVERRPALAAEIAATGHRVGVHCARHRNLMWLTPRQVADDLRRAEAAIAEATGAAPRLYRPPYGILTTAAVRFARRAGWEVVLWAREGHDWEAKATAASIVRGLTRRLGPGDVLLLHDADFYSAPGSWRATVAALPLLFDELAARGLGTASI